MGLVAAIPAVLAYNKLSGDINRYGNRLEAFAGEFSAPSCRASSRRSTNGRQARRRRQPSRGHSRRREVAPMAEINVTPMVDVMLVLLIIFMVTAPLLTVGVEVELPKTSAEVMSNPEEPLVVTVRSDNAVFLQETQIGIEEVGPRPQGHYPTSPTRLFTFVATRRQIGTALPKFWRNCRLMVSTRSAS